MSFVHKCYLASQSPRRRLFAKQIFTKVALIKPVDDSMEPRWITGESVAKYTQRVVEYKLKMASLAYRKSQVSTSCTEVILVADTVVAFGAEVLGKPQNKAQAFDFIKKMSKKTHFVETRFAWRLFTGGKNVDNYSRSVRSYVKFYDLKDAEIKNYLRCGQVMDKSGAYGFQDQAFQFVESVRGSYSNIVGLPLRELRQSFKQRGHEVL